MVSQIPPQVSARQDLTIRLAFALTVVSLAVALLALRVVWDMRRGTDTHFVVSGAEGTSRAGEIPDAFVLGYARDVVEARYSWSFLTILDSQLRFKRFLHPRMQKIYSEEIAPGEAKLAKDDKMTSSIDVLTATVTEREGLKRRVVVQAVRHLYIGSVLRHDELSVTLTLVPLVEMGWPKDVRLWDMSDSLPLNTKR